MRFVLQVLMRGVMAALVLATPAKAVVGGREGGPGEASAVMVLNDRGGICTGVVLARDAVLTAAHCVAAGQVRVHYREQGQPILLEPRAIARHPEFRANAVAERTRSIDLALVRLGQPLPGRFAPASLAVSPAANGAAFTVAGYGLSAEGAANTAGVWRSVSLAAVQPFGESRVLLWLRGGAGIGACQGDSGGPVLDSAGAVAGLISWTTGARGRKCGDLTQAVILSAQRGWIDRTLSGWSAAASWR